MKTTATFFRTVSPAVLLLAVAVTTPGSTAVPGAGVATDVPAGGWRAVAGPAPEAGGAVAFTLTGGTVGGTGWQWQRRAAGGSGWVDVPEAGPYGGAATAVLRLAAAPVAMDGDEFRCVVQGADGLTVASAPAVLRVGPPVVAVRGGDGQAGEAGRFNARPFDLAVWDAAGRYPLAAAAVTFSVQSGGGSLATEATPEATLAASLTLRTDADGTVQAWYRQGALGGVLSEIKATAGSRETLLHTATLDAGGGVAAIAATGAGGSAKAGDAIVRATPPGSARGTGGALAASSNTSGAETKVRAGATGIMRAMAIPAGLQLKIEAGGTNYIVNTTTWAVASSP